MYRAPERLNLWLAGLGLALLTLGLSPAFASSANISHSYRSDKTVSNGSAVSLNRQSGYVEAANTLNGKHLIGIVLDSNDSLLAVDAQAGRVQVATSGTASVLASTLNGDVGVGDQVSVSPFNGIGAKALPGAYVIGLAQTGLNAGTPGSDHQTITASNGDNRQVVVGLVRLSIAIGSPGNGGSQQLNALQRLARSVTGHNVSTVRAVLGLLVALVTILALVVLVYGSIYGSIISIGRNPLARYAVFRTLAAVLLMSVLMTAIAGATIFFLLR
jgi:hypothetical protein